MRDFKRGSNQNTIKTSNRSLVLRVLNSFGNISRAELSRVTGLTKTSITNIVGELVGDGILYETGTRNSSSGRKPILLNLTEDALYSLGVYISRDFAYTNIVNLKGRILKEHKHVYEMTENEDTFLSAIYNSIDDILASSSVDRSKILGIGVASIGPLDINKGIILDPPNFRGLKSIPITSVLKDRFNLEVYLDNDMNASAITERLFGNAKSISNFIYVGVTNGIGAGIMLNNRIFRGSNGFAGEIGHTTIDIRGERCPCGNAGCLELYASIPAIVSQVRSAITLGAESELGEQPEIDWYDIVRAARQGDPVALKGIERLVYLLSAGIVNTVNTFDPEIIFLGHEIALAGDLVTEPLNGIVNANALFKSSKQVKVQLSMFGERAPHVGAPSIVLDKFFSGELG